MQDIADSSIGTIDIDGAKKYALDRLTNELPPTLSYHSIWHTEHEVVNQALFLAAEENLTLFQTVLVHTAALYHDIGFIVTRDEHELISAQIAATVLPEYGYNLDQINVIKNMIMATHLPQKPKNLLEEIIADADMDLLGRNDYISRNRMLRNELALEGHVFSDESWYRKQLLFLQNHRYFTAAARKQRSAQKYTNTKIIDRIYHILPGFEPITPIQNLHSPFLQYTPL